MVAAAMPAARYLDAALRSGMGKKEIDGALTQVARDSGISEIWITDERGRIVFGSGDVEFSPRGGCQLTHPRIATAPDGPSA